MRRIALAAVAVFLVGTGPALAQRSPVSRAFPIYDNGGLPDFTIDPQRFVAQMEIVDRQFHPGDCELEEGTVGATGYRRLLRFDTVIINAGDGDQFVGDPLESPYADHFFFAECHGHYHNEGFSDYRLYKSDGVTEAALGHSRPSASRTTCATRTTPSGSS